MINRSSWFNCVLRGDEALYWVSMPCLDILHKVEIWIGVTDALWADRLSNSQTLKDRATQLPTNTRVELSECNINANIHGSPLDLYWSSHGMIKLFYIANNWLSRSRRQTSDYFHWDSQISTDIILLIRWSESLIVIVKWSNLRVWVRLSDSYHWISTNQIKRT